MAKKKLDLASDLPAGAMDSVHTGPVLRVEDEGVLPWLEMPVAQEVGRAHTVDLGADGRFHHVADGPDGVWIYRRVTA